MPSFNGPRRSFRRWWRVPAVAAGTLALLVLPLYGAAPWLAGHLAPRLAGPLGLDALHLTVERPGLRGLEVVSLRLASGGVHLTARDGRLEYGPVGLLAGRLEAVHFRRMSVRVTESEAPDEPPDAPPPTPERLFAALPAERVHVDMLALEVPALKFRATGSLAVKDDRLDVHLTGLAPEQAQGLTLHAEAAVEGLVRVRLAGHDEGRPPVLDVRSELVAGRLVANGELALRGFALDLAAALAGLPAGEGNLDGTFSASLPWPPPESWDLAALTGEGRLTAAWNAPSLPWALADGEARWQLEGGEVRGLAAGTVQRGERAFAVRASSDALRLQGPAGAGRLVLEEGNGQSPLADLDWKLEEHDLAVEGTFRLSERLLAVVAGQAGLPPGSGSLSGTIATRLPWPLPLDWTDLRPPSRGSVRGNWEGGGIGVSDLRAEWELQDERLSAVIDGRLTYAGMESAAGVTLDTLTLDDGTLSARGTMGLGEALRLPFTASHHSDDARGSLSLSGSLQVDAPLADELIHDWQAPYDVTAGEMDLAADVAWGETGGVDGTVRLDLAALDAHYRDYTVADASGELVFDIGAGGAVSLSPSPLHLAVVNTGVEVRDVDTGVAWSGETLTVQTTTARLLGGTARVEPFGYDLHRGEADFVIDLADVDLARVLALEGDHVSGTGVLDGTLPVSIRGHEPSIVAGQVRSEPPGGVIRVSQALAGAAGQPGLDFALRALQDFRYDLLEADVAYSPEGDLTLAVRLEGRNPDIEGGRPIHYNVTVNENLPILLKSLRLQDQVTREIERQVTD